MRFTKMSYKKRKTSDNYVRKTV